jgi:serine/threonine-protein kinase
MGEVYKANDTSLGRTVAIKVVGGALSADQGARDRLATEARAVASLTHPNICALHGIGETDGTLYVVMEYVDGRTLRAVIDAGGLPAPGVARIGAQVADALAKAHESGIVHRDIKPENVVLSHDGYAKVLDFGLAKVTHPSVGLDSALTGMRTAPGLLVGTLAYMSPEQVRGESPDGRSDIFSLGLVLYELATGRKPFQTDNPLAALHAIAHEPLSLDGIEAPLAAVIERATRKDRNERH